MARVVPDPFEVVRAHEPSAVLVEVPHAGLAIDEASARHTRIPESALAAGCLLADSDVGADVLWQGSEAMGVSRVVALTSRYVIDLNTAPRIPTPYQDKLPAPLRQVMHRSHCGLTFPLDPPFSEEVERRIAEIHEPYHAAITEEAERARALHGGAVILSAHTFPDPAGDLPDVVLGTRHGASAPTALRDVVAAVFSSEGLSVALEEPFSGGWSTKRHARLEQGVSVLQIEVSRRLVCAEREPWHRTLDASRVQSVARVLRSAARAAHAFVTGSTATALG
ncbi:MAG: N-formylglutamate amidohydrolase [Polyangiaceae bacterium]